MVTDKAFKNEETSDTKPEDKGKFTIESDSTVMFTTEIGKSGEQLSILVKSGKHATIKVFKNMTLTNAGLSRSAIDIEPGGRLDLWIAEGATVTVDSGTATEGTTGEMGTIQTSEGGDGGYAGIHCWNNGSKSSILNVTGKGTLIAYGGRASNGGSGVSQSGTMSDGGNGGGRRRRSWCWNRWKWWKRWRW